MKKKIIENEMLKVILTNTILRIVLVLFVGYCLFAIIYFGFGIDDYFEKKNTYKVAEELVSEKEYVEAVLILGSISDYKDTDELKNKIVPIMLDKIDRYLLNKNFPSSEEYISTMKYNLSLTDKENTMLQKRADKLEKLQKIQSVIEREKLKYTDPYEGMAESDIHYSSWGHPTEINKELNYDSLRKDRRIKYYEWIKEDERGRIIEIKSLMVKEGFVWGEPKIFHYYVNQ